MVTHTPRAVAAATIYRGVRVEDHKQPKTNRYFFLRVADQLAFVKGYALEPIITRS